MEIDILPSLPLVFLYAETHFRFFRGFPSLLYRRRPEILFDLPRRIPKGKKLPVMLLVNDTDSFAATIKEVTITISREGSSEPIFTTRSPYDYEINHPFNFQSRVFIFYLDTDHLPGGIVHINASAKTDLNGGEHLVFNDNTPTSSKAGYTCLIADGPLPGAQYCSYGDLHVHSQYSQSHVEFGPPISVISLFAREYGLDFVGITDHSYDLCCRMDNYLRIDPALNRWHNQQKDIASCDDGFTVIEGEEISVLNGRRHVVHLGALGIKRYIPGSLDGARSGAGKADNLQTGEAVDMIHDQGGISFAAHPGAKAGLMQRVFLRRGTWRESDISERLDAFQIVNSGFSAGWYRGRKIWIKALLSGKRLALLAGNDAHGDFNRYRATGTPFVSVKESFDRYLCFSKTGLYGKPKTKAGILGCIKDGKTFVTTGPFLSLCRCDNERNSVVGEILRPQDMELLYVLGIGSEEFGYPAELRVFRGDYTTNRETMILFDAFDNKEFRVVKELKMGFFKNAPGYVRAEIVCRKSDGEETTAATSPCYIGAPKG